MFYNRGLHVNTKYSFSCADGLIECKVCGTGLMEMKRPYLKKENKWRNMTPTECTQDSSFCCTISDLSTLSLKSHLLSTGSVSFV